MGHYRTDQSETKIFTPTDSLDGELIALDVEIDIPKGQVLYLWFTATNRYGCYKEDQSASFEIN